METISKVLDLILPILAVVVLCMNNMKLLLIGEIAMNGIVFLSYILSSGISGAGVMVLAIVQSVIMFFLSGKEKQAKIVTWVFLGIHTLWTVFAFETLRDLLPFACVVFYTLCLMQPTAQKYKVYKAGNAGCWVIYDLLICNYTVLITHGLQLIMSLIGVFKKEKAAAK